ncbi:HAMP domain-containing sensor histidine kinase [Paenibacillus sp.]|uniref:sensor histidine kinase n=1 Tax=Paenibacillus sp. TaxID=58172 RepID=UPI002D240D2E|nr:HAMP domain-containing sensor histidine kinase [Paenibacillus sp.]HZG56851.1 HAMP domain-containing sensor histidine kinase [Paenibacillus sp.]
MSIRLRLTLWYSAVLGVTVIAFCVAVYILVSFILTTAEKKDMESLAERIEREVGVRVGWSLFYGPRVVPQFPALDEFAYSGYFLQMVDANGNVWQKNINGQLPLPAGVEAGAPLATASFMERRIGANTVLIYSRPMAIPGTDAYVGFLQVATTVDDLEKTLAYLRTVLTMTGLLALALASTLGWFLARKALQPIELVIEATNRIGEAEDLGHRIEYDGPPDEIGRLTSTINGMLSRIQTAYGELEGAVRAQRRFVSDASHELRTPLTTIRGNVELLEKMWRRWRDEGALRGVDESQSDAALESVRDIAGEAERMSRMVNDLLMLARADAGHKMRKERVELLPLAEEVARKAAHLPRTAQWVVGDLSALGGAAVIGDADALRQLLFIFIENAFKYTPSGEVELSALRSEDGSDVGFRIRDTGIGMEKEHVPRIFERFYRADASRGETSGTGLGLSIARWIVDEHDGSVEVMTRPGGGTSFVVWLRAAPPEEHAPPVLPPG